VRGPYAGALVGRFAPSTPRILGYAELDCAAADKSRRATLRSIGRLARPDLHAVRLSAGRGRRPPCVGESLMATTPCMLLLRAAPGTGKAGATERHLHKIVDLGQEWTVPWSYGEFESCSPLTVQ
jgi:hypothetical protein